MDKAYRLDSAEGRHDKWPSIFEIPSAERRRSVPVGAFVKLIFRSGLGLTQEPICERMWVKVTERRGEGQYLGVLDNDPRHLPLLECGDSAGFTAEHIIDILED